MDLRSLSNKLAFKLKPFSDLLNRDRMILLLTLKLLNSIALDPLYPSQCSWETFGYATGGGFNGEAEGLSPLRLSGKLNSLGCSVTFHQGDSVSMVKLIEQVRHAAALEYARLVAPFLNYCAFGVEPFPGAAYNLRHPEVLPFPAAVSAQSGHHPGERGEFKATHYFDVTVALGDNCSHYPYLTLYSSYGE